MNELAPPGSGTELERSAERGAGGRMNEPAPLGTAFNPFNRNRAIVISLLALALAGLSFHGGLDNFATTKIDELTKQNLGLLGLAIAIDTVVSFLQTTEVNLFFLSGQVGQALDPINDGVERLTHALLLATGSLLLQDILLTITSGAVFKWGFLAVAATTATCVLLAQSNRVRTAFAASFGVSHVALARFQGVLIKTFIVVTVVRFIVPAFATASLLVSQALVAPEIRQQQEALEQHEKSLSEVGAQISQAGDDAIKEQESQAESLPHDETEGSAPGGEAEPTSSSSAQPALRPEEDLQALREQGDQLERTLASLESEKQRLSDGISERQNLGWKDWIPKFADDPDEALAQANARVEQTESDIARKEWEAACVGRSTTGNDCESYLAEREKQALGERKVQLESERNALRERLQSLQEVRKNAKAATGDEAEGGTGWRDRVAGVVGAAGGLLPESSDEEVQPTVEEIDREVAEASALEKQRALELTCVDRRIAGERCDSPAVDDHVQSALDRVWEGLASDLQRLQTELASRQGEQARLVELAALRAERGQIESEIEEQQKLIERNESETECAERRVAGKDCVGLIERATDKAGDYMARTAGAVEKLSDVGEAAGRMVSSVTERAKALSRTSRVVLDKLKSIADDAKDIVTRLALILVLLVIENIVLPIIFLAIALKACVPIASGLMKISTSITEDTREALSAMDRALPPSRKG